LQILLDCSQIFRHGCIYAKIGPSYATPSGPYVLPKLERRAEAVAGTQFVVIEIFIELAAENFFD
jgi:hypothetical protein